MRYRLQFRDFEYRENLYPSPSPFYHLFNARNTRKRTTFPPYRKILRFLERVIFFFFVRSTLYAGIVLTVFWPLETSKSHRKRNNIKYCSTRRNENSNSSPSLSLHATQEPCSVDQLSLSIIMITITRHSLHIKIINDYSNYCSTARGGYHGAEIDGFHFIYTPPFRVTRII